MQNKKLLFPISLPLLLIVSMYAVWKISGSWDFQFFTPILKTIETDDQIVALTIDDGPTDQKIDTILSLLDSLDIKATFFVNGNRLAQNIDNGKQIVNAGHDLANHTYSHSRMICKSYRRIKTEIEKTDSLIRKAGYWGEIFFRPPGFKKLLILPWYLKQNHRKTIGWNSAPDSQKNWKDEEAIFQSGIEQIEPGSIILMHLWFPSREPSIRALPRIVHYWKEKGYRFVKLSDVL